MCVSSVIEEFITKEEEKRCKFYTTQLVSIQKGEIKKPQLAIANIFPRSTEKR